MLRDLTAIFQEAIEDYSSVVLDDGEIIARIKSGYKIIKEEESIKIYDTSSDYYKEVTEEQYEIFILKGWVNTVLTLTLDKYNKRLNKIKDSYRNEINGRNNARYIEHLKTTRRETMKRYYKITQKLN